MPRGNISSLTNSRVKEVLRLRQRRNRQANALTIVDGGREVLRALQAGVAIKAVYICPDFLEPVRDLWEQQIAPCLQRPAFQSVQVHETAKNVFQKMSYGDREEGILAVCAPRVLSLEEFPSSSDPLFVVAEGVEKPGNLGAILRTCDGAGVDGLISSDGMTDIYNPNVIRASLGTVFTVPASAASNESALAFLRARKARVCAALPRAKTIYTDADLTGPLALVVGSEQDGLTDFWTRQADFQVKIPMKGKADSLNVSVSTAVLLYEAIRQRIR